LQDTTARTWLALKQQELLRAQLLLLRAQLLLLLAQRCNLLDILRSARLLDLCLYLLQLSVYRLDLSRHFVQHGLVAHRQGCRAGEEREKRCA
jgi:hypothetical protein